MIEFTIQGKPCAVQSVRFTQKGIKYQPKRVNEWKSLVRMSCVKEQSHALLTGPVLLFIHAHFERPKRLCTSKWEKETVPYTSKPDCDNLCKGIADALNGVLWHDDSQIVDVRVRKSYAEPNEAPYTLVRIQTLAEVEDGND